MQEEKERVPKEIIITVVLCITLLETIALLKGINGVLLTTIVGILAAIAGITIPQEYLMKSLRGLKTRR